MLAEKDRTALMVAGGLAATVRKTVVDRDRAVLDAWRGGWSLQEIARVTGMHRRRVTAIVRREEDR